jgi:hypothetical protein
MTLQSASGHRETAAKKVHSVIGRCPAALIAVSAGFFAISISSHGADLGTGYATAIAVPAQAAPAGRRPIPARPIDPPDAKPGQRSRIVDQLYDSLMRSSGCSLASSNTSIIGGC